MEAIRYTKDNPLRVFTLCSGYDSQCLALKYLKDNHPDFEFDLVGWSEIEPSAIMAHNLLFPEYRDRNYGDMSRIDWTKVPDFDFLTYSTPCQSVSNAGLRKGIAEGSGTRSSLLWFTRNAIIEKKTTVSDDGERQGACVGEVQTILSNVVEGT